MSPAESRRSTVGYDDHLGEPAPTLPRPGDLFVSERHRRPDDSLRGVIGDVVIGVIVGFAVLCAVEIATWWLP